MLFEYAKGGWLKLSHWLSQHSICDVARSSSAIDMNILYLAIPKLYIKSVIHKDVVALKAISGTEHQLSGYLKSEIS